MEEKDMQEKEAEGKDEVVTEKNGEENVIKKVIFCLCYIWGILFFLPLIMYKDDAEAKTRANEGLVLLLVSVAGNLLFGLLSMIGVLHTLFSVLATVFTVLMLVLGIIGIINVVTDKKQPLPIVGGIKILK